MFNERTQQIQQQKGNPKMDKKFNWSKHIEKRTVQQNFDQHSNHQVNCKQKKFNYENVELNLEPVGCCGSQSNDKKNNGELSSKHSEHKNTINRSRKFTRNPNCSTFINSNQKTITKCIKCTNCIKYFEKYKAIINSIDYHQTIECHSPVNFVNKFVKFSNFLINQTIDKTRASRPTTNMNNSFKLIKFIFILIYLLQYINCDTKLPPILNSVHNRTDFANRLNNVDSIYSPTRSSTIYRSSVLLGNKFNKFNVNNPKELFLRTINSSSKLSSNMNRSIKTNLNKINRLKKRSNSFADDLYLSNKNDDLSLSSETIIEMPSNSPSSFLLDNSLNLNNSTDNRQENQSNKTDALETDPIENVKEEAGENKQDELEIKLKEEQEKVLNEIESIATGPACSGLNKETNFKTKASKDSSKESRDKNYWILVKALEPKTIKMPSLTNQVQPSFEIRNYYRELIEKLELITSILYDNNDKIEQNDQQHNRLMKKIIREISNLHPHILRARLITLNLNKKEQKRRESFNSNFQEYLDHDELNDEQQQPMLDSEQQQNLIDKQKLNSVPFKRFVGDERLMADQPIDQKPNEQWLLAKNILFFMRNQPIYEFDDITMTTKREFVSWLNVKEVEERSGTIKEFDQLLANGHLFVMSEKERLFSGWTGIYFDCAYRKWLLSYTSLLVSCNQCSNKKQSESSVDNEVEMRLIGLLSIDIELANLDLNQCETSLSEIEPSPKSESTKSPIQLPNGQQQTNYQTNEPSQIKNYQTVTNSNQQTDQLKLNAQESNRFTSLLENNYQSNLFHNSKVSKLSNLLKFNDTFINQPQRLARSTPDSISYHNLSKLSSFKSVPNKYGNRLMLHFEKTNKCHKQTSQCHFVPNNGIRRGLGYVCKCRSGYYAVLNKFNGKEIEHAWENQNLQKHISPDNKPYDRMYICKKCSEGCDTCVDSSPCLSSYNWAFRISLLTFSIFCICVIFVFAYYIYKYRKIKVFKVASPVFLTLTLLGCSIMYAEMIMIFPILNQCWCILTKITRHMGFCITYSALLLKTWRVSLTYRVKSAHKLKLTDRQLLQWLFPILLVMTIFLATWIISDPPKAMLIVDWNKLKFTICEYNWFDHSLAIGEFLFLLWGIKVCYNVRNAESFFNEAKYITWAIYNIAAVNILMILIHLIILPNAGPDEKYFLGFLRTQLSTSTTIALIFGPKFYRLMKGEGDIWDKIRAKRGINASFSLNGVGVVHEELTDLYQENEELKEQVHKLATQVELMRLRQMQVNNRHLKSKHNIGSAASSQGAVNSSVVMNSANVTGLVGLANLANSTSPHFHSYNYNQLNPQVDSAGIGLVTGLVGGVVGGQPALASGLSSLTFTQPATVTCQRISPAAELQSEKV